MSDSLKVNEIFYSLQGEGARVGTANIFIRLSGCNLNCWFCDTSHYTYTVMSVREVMSEVAKFCPCKWVVLTGGEPTIQDIFPLLRELKRRDYSVAIETNGVKSIAPYRSYVDWVAVSPKTVMNKYYTFEAPDEVKNIVLPDNEIVYWKFKQPHNCQYFLQPEGNKPENIKRCVEIIKKDPRWRLSLQIQKVIGIR